MNFYMINLDRAAKRRQLMQKHYDPEHLIRISAYDGKYLEEYVDIKYINESFHRENRVSSHGGSNRNCEIACTLSHIKAIVSAYYKGETGAIIIEDDIFNKYHKQWLTTLRDIIVNKPPDCDILYLHEINEVVNRKMISLKELIVRKHDLHWSAGCYYITRNAMKKIIDKYFINKIIDISQENKHIVADLNLFDGMNQYQFTKPLFNSNDKGSFIRGDIHEHHKSEQITDMYFDRNIAVKLQRERNSNVKFKKIFF